MKKLEAGSPSAGLGQLGDRPRHPAPVLALPIPGTSPVSFNAFLPHFHREGNSLETCYANSGKNRKTAGAAKPLPVRPGVVSCRHRSPRCSYVLAISLVPFLINRKNFLLDVSSSFQRQLRLDSFRLLPKPT